MDRATLKYWIGFNRASGIGSVRLRALIDHFGDVERAWNAPAEALASAGLDRRSLKSLIRTRNQDLDAHLEAVEKAGAWIITLDDEDYPFLLRQIPDPPLLLYIRGTLDKNQTKALAVVGTRKATSYGLTMTKEIVGPLASAGITIVSGLARGIDRAAHLAALGGDGRTLAVMATGIDRVYPAEHQQLANAIAEHGALVTEMPLGSGSSAGCHWAR